MAPPVSDAAPIAGVVRPLDAATLGPLPPAFERQVGARYRVVSDRAYAVNGAMGWAQIETLHTNRVRDAGGRTIALDRDPGVDTFALFEDADGTHAIVADRALQADGTRVVRYVTLAPR